MKEMLFNIEFLSDIHSRKTWLLHLIEMLRMMKSATLHWVDRIQDMLLTFSSSQDAEVRLLVIQVMNVQNFKNSSNWDILKNF